MTDPSMDAVSREIHRLQAENAKLAADLADLTRPHSHWYWTVPALLLATILFGAAFWGFWQATHFELGAIRPY